ncbi:hypothetical protein GWL_21250 [Herbaspirillum sp. GW103]|nr:hypothetical protein GWL_21250 [Herbaspirillum sp. GW103]
MDATHNFFWMNGYRRKRSGRGGCRTSPSLLDLFSTSRTL